MATADTINKLRNIVNTAKGGGKKIISAISENSEKKENKAETPNNEQQNNNSPNENEVKKEAEIKAENNTANNVNANTGGEQIPPKPKKENTMSFFDDIKEETEHDKHTNKAEEIAEEILDDDIPEGDEDSPEQKKALAKIKAGIFTEVIDLLFMVLCMWISDDWTERGQKKYSLIPERRKAIKVPIYQLLMLSKKKQKPAPALILVIIGSYAPMIVIAVMGAVRRKVNKREQTEISSATYYTPEQIAFIKANPNLFNQEQREQADRSGHPKQQPQQTQQNTEQKNNKKKEETGRVNNPDGSVIITYSDNTEIIIPPKERKNSAKRHAKDCGVHKKKKCDCGAKE